MNFKSQIAILKRELFELGINQYRLCYNHRTGNNVLYFQNADDMNLYKVAGSFKNDSYYSGNCKINFKVDGRYKRKIRYRE